MGEIADDFATAGVFPPRVRYTAGGFAPCVFINEEVALAHLLRASGRAADSQVEIVLERHVILRYTPCGAWIDTWAGDRFVNLRAEKQWASATEDEAVAQLHHRKRAQVRILGARLAEAEAVLAGLDGMRGKLPPVRRYVPEVYW